MLSDDNARANDDDDGDHGDDDDDDKIMQSLHRRSPSPPPPPPPPPSMIPPQPQRHQQENWSFLRGLKEDHVRIATKSNQRSRSRSRRRRSRGDDRDDRDDHDRECDEDVTESTVAKSLFSSSTRQTLTHLLAVKAWSSLFPPFFCHNGLLLYGLLGGSGSNYQI